MLGLSEFILTRRRTNCTYGPFCTNKTLICRSTIQQVARIGSLRHLQNLDNQKS